MADPLGGALSGASTIMAEWRDSVIALCSVDQRKLAADLCRLVVSEVDRAERRAGEAGADLFLTKPFSPLEVLRLVDEIGERHAVED